MLFSQYKECEEVVVEHRAMKERERLKAEQEERERKAVTKVLQGEGGVVALLSWKKWRVADCVFFC